VDDLLEGLAQNSYKVLYEIKDNTERLSKMTRADAAIVCLSKFALPSPRFRGEITLARSLNKPLIPIALDPCSDLFDRYEETKAFQTAHVIEFFGRQEETFSELLATLSGTPVSSQPDGATSTNESRRPTIFVSYRRDDSADVTGRIYDRLVAHFGQDKVLRDVDSIPLGADFREHLENIVHQCAVELVIIGRQWIDVRNDVGKRRLEDPADFVRVEVESALSRNIPVIPVLVQDASVPAVDQLPPSLSKLAYRNGTVVRRDPDFHSDMDRLIKALEKLLIP
jgi:hypothetical protein